MYALPESEPAASFREAPTMTESPEIATESPNLSPAAAFEAMSLFCSDHVEPLRVKM